MVQWLMCVGRDAGMRWQGFADGRKRCSVVCRRHCTSWWRCGERLCGVTHRRQWEMRLAMAPTAVLTSRSHPTKLPHHTRRDGTCGRVRQRRPERIPIQRSSWQRWRCNGALSRFPCLRQTSQFTYLRRNRDTQPMTPSLCTHTVRSSEAWSATPLPPPNGAIPSWGERCTLGIRVRPLPDLTQFDSLGSTLCTAISNVSDSEAFAHRFMDSMCRRRRALSEYRVSCPGEKNINIYTAAACDDSA